MGQKPVPPADQFSAALNAEIRAIMGRRSVTAAELARGAGMSTSRVSRTVTNSIQSLTTNEFGDICNFLGAKASDVVRAAERALANQYDLAALEEETRPDARDEDYF